MHKMPDFLNQMSFWASLWPEVYDFIKFHAGVRGFDSYIERLVLAEKNNTDDLARVIDRLDEINDTARFLKKLVGGVLDIQNRGGG